MNRPLPHHRLANIAPPDGAGGDRAAIAIRVARRAKHKILADQIAADILAASLANPPPGPPPKIAVI